ncbi:MAG: GIY-YIG nuclease family protein [Patescibacteria group bacterium]
MGSRLYFVYILTNRLKSVLYIGVTNDLYRRLHEHRMKVTPGFSEKYQTTILVYFEATSDVLSAIAREKQLKRWSREKKEWLIGTMNPHWNDLSDEF